MKYANQISGMLLAISAVIFMIAGCSRQSQEERNTPQTMDTSQTINTYESEPAKTNPGFEETDIATIYSNIYEKAIAANLPDNLQIMKTLLKELGQLGCVSVDEGNQVNMEGAEQVIQFCESVEKKEKANLDIIVAAYGGGFTRYHLDTESGIVDVTTEYYQYDKNGDLKIQNIVTYLAEQWEYTKEGYLLFGGNHFSDAYYVLTLGSTPEQAMLRVAPLDETCREMNRRYLLPVGYKQNNLFLTDWDEQDFGDLNFYDLFDCFYPMIYHQPVFSLEGEGIGDENGYRIPKEIFEGPIMSYIQIDSETLREKADYFPEDETYGYRPRRFEEAEYPDIPYPEVVEYRENEDGTITLTVNAVYPYDGLSRAYSHETVIRLKDKGKFEYVSNKMVDLEEQNLWWHSKRQMDDESAE